MGEIGAVIVNYLFGLIPATRGRKRMARARLGWIRISIAHNERCCVAFLRDRVFSPQYRLRVDTNDGLLLLSTDGFIDERETETLADYFARAEEVNRCLEELAAILAERQNEDAAHYWHFPQRQRAELKVRNIIDRRGDQPSQSERASSAIGAALGRLGA